MGVDWSEIVCLMEVSAMLYKCTYCIFTLYGRFVVSHFLFASMHNYLMRNIFALQKFKKNIVSPLSNIHWWRQLKQYIFIYHQSILNLAFIHGIWKIFPHIFFFFGGGGTGATFLEACNASGGGEETFNDCNEAKIAPVKHLMEAF